MLERENLILLISIKLPRHTVAHDVLQSKNAVAYVFIHGYHSLPLVKVLSLSLSWRG